MERTERKKTDLRVVKTYHALNEAFATLLEEEDVASITVNDLCKKAGIRRATFYKHFTGKNEFMDYSIRHMHDKFAREADSQPTDGTVEGFFLQYAKQTLKFLNSHERLIQRLKETHMLPNLLDILMEQAFTDLQKRLEEHAKKTSIGPVHAEVLAAFYTGGLYQSLYWRLLSKEPISEEAFLDELQNVVHRLQ